MPVYDYSCGKCAHKFEMRRSFSEGPKLHAPLVRAKLTGFLPPVPIVFKGSGFYVTDYRKEKAPLKIRARPRLTSRLLKRSAKPIAPLREAAAVPDQDAQKTKYYQ